jgi:hypothetical protein
VCKSAISAFHNWCFNMGAEILRTLRRPHLHLTKYKNSRTGRPGKKKKKKPDGLWNKLKMLHLRFSISLIWETCYRRKFEDTRHIKAKAYQCLTSKHTMRQWKLLSQVPKADAQTLNITPYCSSDPWLNKRCITLHIQLRSNPFISECRRQSILYGNSLRKHQISTFSITHDIHH